MNKIWLRSHSSDIFKAEIQIFRIMIHEPLNTDGKGGKIGRNSKIFVTIFLMSFFQVHSLSFLFDGWAQ